MKAAVWTICLLVAVQQVHSFYNPYDYNLNLQNFEYFKYPYQGKHSPPREASVAQKALAVVSYFHTLLAGHPVQEKRYYIPFDPNRGQQLRGAFQRQFGFRGENLIALIGNGYSPKALRYYGAIGKDFGKY
ncbi:AGAP005315-PA-like protein [Anopheles sinensis]|uniref:AGAP005315-PA-like protein n=1 Tax=Anopheles sinensis TaxID=74873 RepID=A0A084W2I0_ANOSI|nr:AGAP005315-PA-like protein [Anopheles sinensis]